MLNHRGAGGAQPPTAGDGAGPAELSPGASAMLSPAQAGALNRARVLRTLYDRGPLPRPELARATGSTRATIGQIVQPMLDGGLLFEGEPLASGSQGGKRARPLWFSDDGWLVGAAVLLPRGAQVALVSAGGQILDTRTVSFGPGRIEHPVVIARLATALRDVAGTSMSALRGVGVAVGGLVDTVSGEIVRVDLVPRFDELAIGPALAAELKVPTWIDNHGRAQALGDGLFGLGRGQESFCSLYFGEGIGAGFILDGRLHRGRRGAGGEVGHMVLDHAGARCACGQHGCWETLAATRWLHRAAAERGVRGARTTTVARLVDRAGDDPAAAAVLRDYVANVGLGIASLQQILGVGLFIVHGDPVQGGEQMRADIEAEVRRRAFPHPGGAPSVQFADADDFATLRGAAAVVLSGSLNVAF